MRMRTVWTSSLVMSLWGVTAIRASDPPAPSPSQPPAAAPTEPPKADQPSTARTTPPSGKSKKDRNAPPVYSEKAIQRSLRSFDRLHEMMLKDLQLTDEQKTKVARIIESHKRDVRGGKSPPGVFRGREEDFTAAQRTDVYLQNRYGGKHASRGDKAVQEGGWKNRPPASPFDSPSGLIGDLAQELPVEQHKDFAMVAERWQILMPRVGLRDGPLQRVMRTVKDPGLDITPDQRESYMNMVGAAMKSVRDDRFNQQFTQAAADSVRSDIMKELMPPQQEHFSSTLKELQAEADREAQEFAKIPAQKKEEKKDAENK